jgi:hypothetical protein
MRRTMTAIALTAALLLGHDVRAAEARRITRCCVMVPDDGGTRPYCFGLRTRTKRIGRFLCRSLGGRPQHQAER